MRSTYDSLVAPTGSLPSNKVGLLWRNPPGPPDGRKWVLLRKLSEVAQAPLGRPSCHLVCCYLPAIRGCKEMRQMDTQSREERRWSTQNSRCIPL